MTSNEELIAELIADVHVLPEDVRDYEVIGRLLERVVAQSAAIAAALAVETDRSLRPEGFWPKYKEEVRAALSRLPADGGAAMAEAWDKGAKAQADAYGMTVDVGENPYRAAVA